MTTSEKPRVVKLKIHAEGERQFWTDGRIRKAVHYVVHVDIGCVTGTVAKVIGKQPPDTHIWIFGAKAPTFVRFEGSLYGGGPIWDIELANMRWGRPIRPKTKEQ